MWAVQALAAQKPRVALESKEDLEGAFRDGDVVYDDVEQSPRGAPAPPPSLPSLPPSRPKAVRAEGAVLKRRCARALTITWTGSPTHR
jgi:hypothetical protein